MSQYVIPVVWSPDTRLHDPRHEVWVGVPTPATEVAQRVDVILDRLVRDGHRPVRASTQPDDVLAAVHSAELLAFLREASDRWRAGPYEELVGQDRVVPYLFPTAAMSAGLPVRAASAVHADAGRFGYDTMTLVGPGTWTAARAAGDCARAAAQPLRGRELLGGGLRPDRGRAARCRRAAGRRRAADLRAVPATGPPRDPRGLRGILLPE